MAAGGMLRLQDKPYGRGGGDRSLAQKGPGIELQRGLLRLILHHGQAHPRGTELLHMCVNVPLCPLRLLRRKALITPGIGEQRLHVAVQVLEVDVVDVEADGLGAAAADEGAGTAFSHLQGQPLPGGVLHPFHP